MRYSDDNISIEALIGAKLGTITRSKNDDGNDLIVFNTDRGVFHMTHWQDCCECVTLEDGAEELRSLEGGVVFAAEERSQVKRSGKYGDVEEWTFYHIATADSEATLRWYGSSNGYYSTHADFYRVSE